MWGWRSAPILSHPKNAPQWNSGFSEFLAFLSFVLLTRVSTRVLAALDVCRLGDRACSAVSATASGPSSWAGGVLQALAARNMMRCSDIAWQGAGVSSGFLLDSDGARVQKSEEAFHSHDPIPPPVHRPSDPAVG